MRGLSSKALLLMAGLMTIATTGCLGNRTWEYPPNPKGTYLGMMATKPLGAKLVVLPLDDLRGKEAQVEYWKVAIPLIPYGVTAYDRPETAVEPEPVDVVLFDPPRDFARALADELREAAVFSTVAYANQATAPSSDFVMRGHLRSTRWERAITTYLLGPLGTVFWMLGLPMGNTVTSVEMDLNISPAGNPSNIVWSFTMEFQGKEYDGPYYGLEEAIQSYPVALQETLRPAITNLVHIAEKRPEVFQVPR